MSDETGLRCLLLFALVMVGVCKTMLGTSIIAFSHIPSCFELAAAESYALYHAVYVEPVGP